MRTPSKKKADLIYGEGVLQTTNIAGAAAAKAEVARKSTAVKSVSARQVVGRVRDEAGITDARRPRVHRRRPIVNPGTTKLESSYRGSAMAWRMSHADAAVAGRCCSSAFIARVK